MQQIQRAVDSLRLRLKIGIAGNGRQGRAL
jgi:hypothetical protein